MATAMMQRVSRGMRHPGTTVALSLFGAGWCGLGGLLTRFAPNFYHRRIGRFWLAPRWHTVWVDILLVALAVWCIHAGLRLLDEIAERKQHQATSRKALMFAVGHWLVVLTVTGYAWRVIAAPAEEFVVTAQGRDIHGEFYRALRVEPGDRRARPRRPTAAWLERRVAAKTDQFRIERGNWWPSQANSYQLALARARLTSDSATLHDWASRAPATDQSGKAGLGAFLRRAIHRYRQRHRHSAEALPTPIGVGDRQQAVPIDPEWAGEQAFAGMQESPVVLLRVHPNLAVTLAVVASVLLWLGALAGWILVAASSKRET